MPVVGERCCRAWMQHSHQDSTVCKTAIIAGGKRGVTLVKCDATTEAAGWGCRVMSRETILQTKDLSAGRHPAASAKESLSKSQNLDWQENFLEGINIHYYSWSILLYQEETRKVWLHLLGDPVHDFLGINMHLIFLSETAAAAIIWTAKAVWEIDVNSEIELSPPNSGDALCVLWLFYQFPVVALQLLPPLSLYLLFH